MTNVNRWRLRAFPAFALIAASMSVTNVQAAPLKGGTAAAFDATVDQPRPFGYVVGDLVTQRVLLQVEGREFVPAALPRIERLGVWLERRPARIESASDGHRWLAVDYQVINAPQALTTVILPAWELQRKPGGTMLRIPEWPISVNTLTPRTAFATDGLDELRPDRAAPIIATAAIWRQIGFWCGAFMLTLAAWSGWIFWRNWRAASNQPFARALREMRHVEVTAPEAWQALHRAFDRTAGRATQTATLSVLFQRAPHLETMRPRIEQFFAQSGELFFGGVPPADPMPLQALCRDLRQIEKRHER